VGIYIVHPSYRGNGYGLKLFQHAVQHLKALQSPPPASPLALPHTPYIGLDAVPEQTENYKKFGFQTAYVVTRYSFPVPREMMVQDPFHGPNLYSFLPPFYKKFWPHVQAYDEKCFPAPRRPLLEKLVKSPESFVAIYQNSETPDRIQGFGVLRPGNKGYLVGPLFADSLEIAIAIINHLLASVPPLGEPTSGLISFSPFNRVLLDTSPSLAVLPFSLFTASISLPEIQEQETFIYVTLPETNPHGQTLVQSFGMEPLCVTIRMYLDGARPEEKNENIFSLTALEVG
jgi:hypothetical protein